jgi:hypothetical protein
MLTGSRGKPGSTSADHMEAASCTGDTGMRRQAVTNPAATPGSSSEGQHPYATLTFPFGSGSGQIGPRAVCRARLGV